MSENLKFSGTNKAIGMLLSARNKRIIAMSKLDQVSVFEIAKKLDIGEKTAEREMQYLANEGYLKEVGEKKSDGWANRIDYVNMRKGDKIEFAGKIGTLLDDAHYEVNKLSGVQGSGLYYADIAWEDNVFNNNFMLNRNGLKWKPSTELGKERIKSKVFAEKSRGDLDRWVNLV